MGTAMTFAQVMKPKLLWLARNLDGMHHLYFGEPEWDDKNLCFGAAEMGGMWLMEVQPVDLAAWRAPALDRGSKCLVAALKIGAAVICLPETARYAYVAKVMQEAREAEPGTVTERIAETDEVVKEDDPPAQKLQLRKKGQRLCQTAADSELAPIAGEGT